MNIMQYINLRIKDPINTKKLQTSDSDYVTEEEILFCFTAENMKSLILYRVNMGNTLIIMNLQNQKH